MCVCMYVKNIQILSIWDLLNVTSNFHTVATIVNVDLQIAFPI